MILLVTALVLVLLAAGGWRWTRSQYFVGESGGYVAVFQGIPQGPGAHGFATVESVSETQVTELPEFERSQVEANISATDVNDALRVVATLSKAAEECRQVPTPAGCPGAAPVTPNPTPSPSPPPTGSPSAPAGGAT